MNITINQTINSPEAAPDSVLPKLLNIINNNGSVNLKGKIFIQKAFNRDIAGMCQHFNLTEDQNTPGTYRVLK